MLTCWYILVLQRKRDTDSECEATTPSAEEVKKEKKKKKKEKKARQEEAEPGEDGAEPAETEPPAEVGSIS